MVVLSLKADIALCRRCCGNPFLGEVLAGCLECLQLGRNEHTSPRDVVCAALDVEVEGIVSLSTSLNLELSQALVFTSIAPAMAWNWGCSGCLSAGRPAAKASQWVDSTKRCAEGTCQSSALLALPTESLIHPCAPYLPPVYSALVSSQNWALAGQDSHVRLTAVTLSCTVSQLFRALLGVREGKCMTFYLAETRGCTVPRAADALSSKALNCQSGPLLSKSCGEERGS